MTAYKNLNLKEKENMHPLKVKESEHFSFSIGLQKIAQWYKLYHHRPTRSLQSLKKLKLPSRLLFIFKFTGTNQFTNIYIN